MKDFTVAICTCNGAKRLPEILEKLRSQVGTEGMRWEILIVDSNSNDDTQKVIQEYQANKSITVPIRYLFEPKQGVAFARRLAVREAKSDLVGFLEDGNYATPTWVIAAYAFGRTHPQAGAYGSQIRSIFDSQLPKNFQRIACHLVTIERQPVLEVETCQQEGIAEAGMVVRRQAWLASVSEQPVSWGSGQETLASKGEEIDVQACLWNAGWQIWYNPEMVIDHHMSTWRLDKSYWVSYFQKIGLNRHRIRMMGYRKWQQPLMVLPYVVNDLRKVLIHLIKYRKTLSTDLVATCEMILFLNSFYSPFHSLKQKVLCQLRLLQRGQSPTPVVHPVYKSSLAPNLVMPSRLID
ncbi:MAG: hormogonium polysaccharide biosynthesis glycosyltransferase HpsE [Scytolyngbya sp. HA4215-MV1]|jgi:glycosyltransferase involved in cell wall biosynthesis|nr:hormogonium polysaccharide biosynthesis glycosyltransferase HpsE [Scytolyngbya sp. HA4215-MV1]